MALVIKSFKGDARVLKAQIAAQFNGVDLHVEEVAEGSPAPVGPGNPAGKLPVLETASGTLFESNAIARYIARIRRDTDLTGRSFFETAQVDAWVDFASHDVEVPAVTLYYPILGWSSANAALHDRAVADLNKALSVLEAHLLPRSYLVGEGITLADIVLVCTLFYPFKLVFNVDTYTRFPSVTRWFYSCVGRTEFANVVGFVPVSGEGAPAAGAGAPAPAAAAGGAGASGKGKKGGDKAAAPAPAPAPKPAKEKPAPKPKEDDDDGGDDMPKEVPKADPFAGMAKSTMVLDEWKRTYSNSKHDFRLVMPWFWEHLDKAGYALWLQKYKYNEENKRDFMTSNLVGGFIQRTDELRKYAFGVMHVLNEAAPFEVAGMWLIRGKDIKPMLDCNPDAEYYDWTMLDADNPEHRAQVEEYWCQTSAHEGDKLFGKAIYDTRQFK